MSAVWKAADAKDTHYPQLQGAIDVDVAVIGAGVTGLATALHLAESGLKVAVVEAHRVGSGSTGGSTGNLYATLSQGLAAVRKKWDNGVVGQVVGLRASGIDTLEEIVNRYAIECEFARRPLYFCVDQPDQQQVDNLTAEYDATRASGLSAELVNRVPELPFPVHRALRIENQAQYNPMKFVQGLARALTELGGLIFESSAVCDIDAGRGIVSTVHGKIVAPQIVQATHTPKGINLLQAEMEVYREYGVAAEIEDACPEGIFWMRSDSRSVRTYSRAGRHYLIVVGEKHKTGHNKPGENYYDNLRAYSRTQFGATEFTHAWSAQQYRAADLLPYIGRSGHHNVFVATGYAADGLTWAMVAAPLISNQVLGAEAVAGSELFNPRRFTPIKSAKNWINENTNVTRHLVQDYLTGEQLSGLKQVAPGEGKILKLHGEKLAVFRSADDVVSVLSPVCPHMKCMVHWNAADITWDCPCHGSRFATDGSVLEGPAYLPLSKRTLKD